MAHDIHFFNVDFSTSTHTHTHTHTHTYAQTQDYALVLVDAGHPPTAMTVQHLKLCINMNIPVVVLLTKTDQCPDQVFRDTKQTLVAILKSRGLGLCPFMVKNEKDVELVHSKMSSLAPIMAISCTDGTGLDLLRKLLTKLPQRRQHTKKQIDKPFEFLVEEIFQVRGIGTVVSGFVTRGTWEMGEPFFMGPLKDGSVIQVVPKSVHVAKTCVNKIWAGHQVCFALPKLSRARRRLLEKGMIAMKQPFTPSRKFLADIYLTKGSTMTVQSGKFETTVHILHMKQTAKVVEIRVNEQNKTVIRQGDTARVTFQFSHRPSFIRPGMRVILRCGHIIGYGVIRAPL
jgi:GTPase